MNRKLLALISILSLVPFSAFAGVKVAYVDLHTNGPKGQISIKVDGRSSELPDLKVNGETIEITLHKADAFNAINRTVRGTQLSANVVNGKAIVKAVLPYAVSADQVSLDFSNNGINVIFPRGKAPVEKKTTPAAAAAVTVPAPATTAVKEVAKAGSKVSKDVLNEDYLNRLMDETKAPKEEVARRESDIPPVKKKETTKDTVSLKQAAPAVATKAESSTEATSNDGFSFAGYAAKFTIFLAMVLGLFYGVVQLLKKGVFNRGKLGFLNNNGQLIEVLSTTYVGPKRTLMVVRAHKQIFLVGNSETGLTFLSEMKDTSGLLKEGERQITGTNFDLNLTDAESTNTQGVTLKENIMESTPLPEEKGIAALSAKDIVKFSEELKKKARKLKPIEFNN